MESHVVTDRVMTITSSAQDSAGARPETRGAVMTAIPELDEAIRATDDWITDLTHRLAWHHRGRGYLALVSTLHALRDCMPTQEAIYFGAQLPFLLRGVYYEGWHPTDHPICTDYASFFSRIQDALHKHLAIDPTQVARAVFALVAERIDASELENVKVATPAELRNLWPS
jgi:uncharacterized protein (DUF2267 family)